MMRANQLPGWVRMGMVGRRRLHRDDLGASSSEYMMILALVVIPIGLLLPLFFSMIVNYSTRVNSMIGLPFP